LLACFTAIYFFQCESYSSGLISFSLERTLTNTPLFIIGVVHATTNIKDIYFATIVFSQQPLWKKFQKLATSYPFDIRTAIRRVLSVNVTTHSPCISPAFVTAELRLSFKCVVCN